MSAQAVSGARVGLASWALIAILLVCGTAIAADAETYLKRGRIAFERADVAQAIADFDRAIEADPSLAQAWFQRALAKRRQGDGQGAIQDLSAAIERQQDRRTRAGWLTLRATLHGRSGDVRSARRDLDRAIEADGSFASAFSARGWLNAQQKRYESALSDFDRAIALKPSLYQTYLARAVTHEKLGHWDSAASDYRKVIELDADNGLAYKGIAGVYRVRGDRKRAARNREESAAAFIRKGLSLAEAGKYPAAVAQYGQAIKLSTRHDARALYSRAIAYDKARKHSQALADLDAAIARDGTMARAYLRRGAILARRHKDYAGARRDWQRAAELDPDGDVGEVARKNLERLGER